MAQFLDGQDARDSREKLKQSRQDEDGPGEGKGWTIGVWGDVVGVLQTQGECLC